MSEPSLVVPDTVTFEQAIAISQSLLAGMEQGSLTEPQINSVVASLVSSENGARGFFVTYLTDERPFADQPTDAVMQALASSPEVVSELLVKNLAMSTAMAIAHRRNENEVMAQGSDRVQRRTLRLLQLIQLPEAAQKAQTLHESATTGIGSYQAFLDRWNYDAEQRQQIAETVKGVVAEQDKG
ncbi:hypothetical protein IFO70_25830 [Phormidium tenue FACHB-886]|nr:hypothetical protein [Phormidium tenue FACHB-886]